MTMHPKAMQLWLPAAVSVLLLGLCYYAGIDKLLEIWGTSEEYSYGYLIPVISLFLAWQRKNELAAITFTPSWSGVGIVVIGLVMLIMGMQSTIFMVVHYSLVVTIFGLVLAVTGWRGMRILWVAVFFLIFMIPLPVFLYRSLSEFLQLVSSELGVAVIRLFGISVYLEGNVIDLGIYKLQVAEACNGLRYLFPLLSFGFLCAYLFRAPFWQRAVVFLSTIPITVLMNSFRIGVIGVLVNSYGIEQAEGFLHDFEGWFIFMACLGVLFAEMWLLTWLRKDRPEFSEVFGVDLPGPAPARAAAFKVSAPFVSSLVLLALAAGISYVLGQRAPVVPERKTLVEFPDTLGEWKGRRDALATVYLDALKLDDYIISDYHGPDGQWVNFYVAWYNDQAAGSAAHSPRSCIPGGGWQIKTITRRTLEDVYPGRPLVVNRVQIQKGEHRQLVYYWFQEQGRLLASEYWVKWYLFWDSLTMNRSDGALVRLTTALGPGEDWADGDRRLLGFSRELRGRLGAFLPE